MDINDDINSDHVIHDIKEHGDHIHDVHGVIMTSCVSMLDRNRHGDSVMLSQGLHVI